MSRIGKKPIAVPEKVNVKIDQGQTLGITIEGPKGSLFKTFPNRITVKQEENFLVVQRSSDNKTDRALHGMVRSIVASMIEGVTEGFVKILDIVGVGYRVEQKGKGISLSVMYSHPVEYTPVEGVTLDVEGNNRIKVSGIDKQAVGQVAASIRSVRPPNVYTGKGVRYFNESVKLKPGKSPRKVV